MLKKRFRRKRSSEPPSNAPRVSPLTFTAMMFAVAVLLMVIAYDRRGVREGGRNLEAAQEMVNQGLYSDAVEEYEKALGNSRLSRKKRAEAALALGDIYYEQFEDYPQAYRNYTQARSLNGAVVDSSSVRERIRTAKDRSSGTAVVGRRRSSNESGNSTTQTIIQRVQLIAPPAEDERGPVVASYRGGVIRAGELRRVLRGRTEFYDPEFRREPGRLRDFLDKYLEDEIVYEAAIEAGVHRSPDISERLYEFQKHLVIERLRNEAKEDAMTVTNEDVTSYYNANFERYNTTASVNIAVLKFDSETSAGEALIELRSGKTWDAVAQAFTDAATTATGEVEQLTGTFTEGDTDVPGVGQHPSMGQTLLLMSPGSVTSVTRISGHFFIFKVVSNNPGRKVSLEQARGQIEQQLRGTGVTALKDTLHSQVKASFDPKVEQAGLDQFWNFALRSGSPSETTDTVTVESPTTSGASGN